MVYLQDALDFKGEARDMGCPFVTQLKALSRFLREPKFAHSQCTRTRMSTHFLFD